MTRRQSGSRKVPCQVSPLVIAVTERTPSCSQDPALSAWAPLPKAHRSRIDHRPRSFVHFSSSLHALPGRVTIGKMRQPR